MRCEQFERRLHQVLDRREVPSEDPRLSSHARQCPPCRQRLAACHRLLTGLDLLELPVPGDDFPLQVVRRAERPRRQLAAHRRFQGVWASLAVGLALALLVPLAWYAHRSQAIVRHRELAARPVAPATAIAGKQGNLPAGISRSPRPAHAGPGPKLGVAASTSLAIDRHPPLALLRVWTASWSDRWNPVDELTDGLTPITTPLGVAVEEIRRTIPLGQVEAPQPPSADSVRKDPRHQTPRIA